MKEQVTVEHSVGDKVKIFGKLFGDLEVTDTLIVLIHGLINDWETWVQFVEHSKVEGHSFLLLDLPGYGNSDQMESYTFDKYSELLEEFVAYVKNRYFDNKVSVWIGGLSMGAMIATKCVLKHSADFDGLILFGPMVNSRLKGPFYRLVVKNAMYLLNYLPLADRAVGWALKTAPVHYAGWINNTTTMSWKNYRDITLNGLRRTTGKAFICMVLETILYDGSAIIERLSKDKPVIILAGENDRFIKNSEKIKEITDTWGDRVRCEILKRTGHVLVFERPAESMSYVVKFMGELK